MKHFKQFKNIDHFNKFTTNNVIELPNVSIISLSNSIKYEQKMYDSKIEYLEATGNQRIQVPFNKEYSVYCKFLFTKNVKQQRVFAGGKIGLYENGSNRIAYNRFDDWHSSDKSANVNRIYEFEYHRDTLEVYVDNSLNYTYDKNDELETNTAYLFCKSGGNSYHLCGRIYEFKLYNADRTQIMHHYIPVRKDGIGYMYDIVENKLYGDSTNSFILGPDISNIPKKYTPIDYIESTGSQYISMCDLYGGWNNEEDYGFWDINSIYKVRILYYAYSNDQTAQAALFSMAEDYFPTLFYNSNNGIYWKYPLASVSLWHHINPGTLSNRQVKISGYNVITTAELEYACTSNDYKQYAPVLFARALCSSTASLQVDRKIKAKLYEFKMWKDDKLIIDCIPCKNNKNEIGLYETINKKFIKSYERTPFISRF